MVALVALAGLFFGALALLLLVVSRRAPVHLSTSPWRQPQPSEVEDALRLRLASDVPSLSGESHPALTEVARQVSYAMATGAARSRESLEPPEEMLRRLYPSLVASIDEFLVGPIEISGPDADRAADILVGPLRDALGSSKAEGVHALAASFARRQAVVVCCIGQHAGSLETPPKDSYSTHHQKLELVFLPAPSAAPTKARLWRKDKGVVELLCVPASRPGAVVLTTGLVGIEPDQYSLQIHNGSGWITGPSIVLA